MSDDIFETLSRSVVDMDEDGARAAARAALAAGIDACEAVVHGLAKGMEEAGRLYDEHVYWVPELICCGDAMRAGVEVLRPHFAVEAMAGRPVVVLGTVQGDVHDIGKDLVGIMLDAAGFTVHDLGHDVPAERFVSAARESGATLIGLSSLMTTTRVHMREVVALVSASHDTASCRVLIGGAAVTEAFAKLAGAHGYARDAIQAVDVARRLVADGGEHDD